MYNTTWNILYKNEISKNKEKQTSFKDKSSVWSKTCLEQKGKSYLVFGVEFVTKLTYLKLYKYVDIGFYK